MHVLKKMPFYAFIIVISMKTQTSGKNLNSFLFEQVVRMYMNPLIGLVHAKVRNSIQNFGLDYEWVSSTNQRSPCWAKTNVTFRMHDYLSFLLVLLIKLIGGTSRRPETLKTADDSISLISVPRPSLIRLFTCFFCLHSALTAERNRFIWRR